MRILVVDDASNIRAIAQAQFPQAQGFKVLTADSFTAAADMIRASVTTKQPIDAILTSMDMRCDLAERDSRQITFREGPSGSRFPVGQQLERLGLEAKIPYIGILSAPSHPDRPSLTMDVIDPWLKQSLLSNGLPVGMSIIGNSLCFRTNRPDFHGFSLPASPEVRPATRNDPLTAPAQRDAEMRAVFRGSIPSTSDASQVWQAAAQAGTTPSTTDSIQGYVPAKDWQGLLAFMIKHDPEPSARQAPSVSGVPPTSAAPQP